MNMISGLIGILLATAERLLAITAVLRLEHGFVKALQEKVLSVENIKLILDRTSEKVKDR